MTSPQSTPHELAGWIVESRGLVEEHSWKRLARAYLDLEEQVEAERQRAATYMAAKNEAVRLLHATETKIASQNLAIGDLEEQVEALQRERDQRWPDEWVQARANELVAQQFEIKKLKEQLETLRVAAAKVSEHHFDTCDLVLGLSPAYPCSCGVDALRRALSNPSSTPDKAEVVDVVARDNLEFVMREWHALAGGPISLVSQQNPETGEWEPAVPLQDSYRHWPWLQRIVDWLWSRKASNPAKRPS